MTIFGSDLTGSVSTSVFFDGVYEFEPAEATSTRVVVYVPEFLTFSPGQHTVEVRSNDGTGVRVHGPVTFTVEAPSGGPPLIGLPETVVAEAEDPTGANVIYNHLVSAISADGTPIAIDCTPASGSRFAMGTTTVQCSATDAGGTTTGSFVIFVTDTTPPELTVPEDIVTDNPVVTFTATAVDEIDGPLTVTCTPASGSTFPSGTTRVRCSATDSHANNTTDFFNVRVTGGPPLLILPDDIMAEATSAAGAVVTYTASAEDATSFGCTPASGSTFALGNTTVTCTASNAAGTTTGTFLVTVQDTTGPALSIPTVVEAEATSPAGATVSYSASATDAVDGPRPIDCQPASGTFFAFGTTTVSCTSTDTRGNESAATFDVIVQDTTAPTITVATANPKSLWPPNHKMVPIALTVEATDAVDPAPVIQIVEVTSNQPVDGTGDGDTAPDWVITGPLSLELRAERAGSQDRIYTITVSATDLYGNVGTATVTVTVAQAPKKARAMH